MATSSSDAIGASAHDCYDRGVQLLQGGDIPRAILQFQQATFFDTENANPLAALAECHVFLCDLPSAVHYYRRALWVLTRRRRAQRRQYEREHGPMMFLVGHQTDTNALYCVTPPQTPPTSSLPVHTPVSQGQDAAEAIRVPGAGPNGHTKAADFGDDSGVPLVAVQRRLASLLDALSLALFRLANYDQALRFSLEALDVLGERVDMHVNTRPLSGSSSLIVSDPPARTSPSDSPSTATRAFAPTVQLHRCTYLIALQRTEEAEHALEAFVKCYPSHYDQAGALLVQLYCNRQAFSAARKMVEGLETRCTSIRAQNQSLKIAKHIFNKQYMRYRAKALERRDLGTISKCIDVYPNDVDLLFTRATLHIESGESKRSVKDLFQCVRETNGQHRGAIDAMTSVLFSLGTELGGGGENSLQEAIAYYTESLKWRPDNPLVILARADCYVKLEDYQEALVGYRKLLEINPEDNEAQQRIAFLHDRWGRKLHAMGQIREAEQEFTMAIKSSDKEPLFYYHRALCRFALGEPRYGLRDVLSCQHLHPADPRIRAFIVRYLGSDEAPDTSHDAKEAEARALLAFNEDGDATLAQRGLGAKSFPASATRAAALYGQPSARLQQALAPSHPQPPTAPSAARSVRHVPAQATTAARTANSQPPALRTYKDLVIAQNQQANADQPVGISGNTADERRFKYADSKPPHGRDGAASRTPFVMVQGARTNIHAREPARLPASTTQATAKQPARRVL